MIRAWIFSAGLVLGFSKFAGEPQKDIEDSCKAACDVLDSTAATSPQTLLYHELLISMSDAVVKYRYRVSAEARRKVQHYIDKVLVIHPLQHMDDITQDYLTSEIATGDADYQHANASVDPVAHVQVLDSNSSIADFIHYRSLLCSSYNTSGTTSTCI